MLRSLLVGLCIVTTLTACTDEAKESAEVIRPIRTMEVGQQEQLSERKFPGRAAASDSVTLAFEVSGKLNEITINIGDKVKKGDVLASLDDRDFRNVLDQSKAELKRAKAQYARMKNALADNAVARQDVTNAEAAYESAKATVEIHQKALDDTQLHAPYDGIITEKQITSFGNVQAKQPAIRIVDPTRIEMEADIPESIISYVGVGMEILVEFDAFPDVTIVSKVSEIGNEASQLTRTYPVTLIMDQPEEATILPGMSGKAWRAPQTTPTDIPASFRGFEVPLTAILSDTDQQNYVWVINPDSSIVSRIAVTTGELTQKGVLVQGLEGGELIATAGVNSLQEGQKVRVIK